MKTNAVRVLDTLNLSYVLLEYNFDPNNLGAEVIAEKVNRPPEQVFKTLVVRGDRSGVCLAVIPANTNLDLKALARAMGDRNVEPVPLKEVQPLTGYIRGGVTALACKKNYPVFVDELAQIFDRICVSGGMRGLMIELAPDDYMTAVNGTYAPIAQDKF